MKSSFSSLVTSKQRQNTGNNIDTVLLKETKGHDLGVDCVVAIPEQSFILDRLSCPNNTATQDRLQQVRALFDFHNINAYIITIEDVHMQFTTSLHDRRLQAVSGFSGVIGLGVVTRSTAALWTDGRTFIQATEEVDCGWEIYRKGGPNTTSVTDWIKEHAGDNATVGSNPNYMYSVWWKNFDFVLSKNNLTLKAIEPDLVDKIWTSDRPPQPSTDINVLDIKYAGRKWEDKLRDVRKDMTQLGVDVLVTTGLDEIAWLYNIRARDIEYEPYPYAFSIVQHQTTSIYIMDSKSKLSRPSSDPESLVTLKEHLKTNNNGQCSRSCVQVKEYNHSSFVEDIVKLAGRKDIKKIMVSFSCNYKIYSSIPEEKLYQGIPPTLAHKARKNDVERMGMRHAVLEDSVKMVSLFARMEKEISEGIPWTVYKATIEAIHARRELNLYRDESFLALAGSGISTVPLLAYPVENASRHLATSESFLMDSGGQYLDGTSDLTRTFHYGIPSDHEKEIYTRVLMAHLNLAMHKFPVGRTGKEIDSAIRQPLWEIGVDYPHETGHGIAHYGVVVEGPARISSSRASYTSDIPLETNFFGYDKTQLLHIPDPADYPVEEDMCFSNEPGYYEVGKFGMRIENVVIVKKMNRNNNFSKCHFLEFDTITFVPYEPHLIKSSVLSDQQIKWINNYHKEVWVKVSPYLKEENDTVALEWLHKRVQPLFTTHEITEIENTNNGSSSYQFTLDILTTGKMKFTVVILFICGFIIGEASAFQCYNCTSSNQQSSCGLTDPLPNYLKTVSCNTQCYKWVLFSYASEVRRGCKKNGRVPPGSSYTEYLCSANLCNTAPSITQSTKTLSGLVLVAFFTIFINRK
ncbi:pepP [Mytilus edulis]|uniref:PepP n=1 Tax=Mytilus edulis TaxID=6550 RepID=A0A8S3RQT2_MYTED|nr:pepP [Mytilus edulis]